MARIKVVVGTPTGVMAGVPTWDDIAWPREQWDGPLMIKGVTHPDDARQAVAVGATALSVSNHGGNNLDGTPATIRALPGALDAVGDEIEILLDGEIRRGSDVVKAVALGARAVMIGRAALWGLAANGEAGVANVLEILRAGIDETMVGLGRSSVTELTPAGVVAAPGFCVCRRSSLPDPWVPSPTARPRLTHLSGLASGCRLGVWQPRCSAGASCDRLPAAAVRVVSHRPIVTPFTRSRGR